MSVGSILENGFVTKLAYTIAASAIIGGGTVVLNNQSRIAVIENSNQGQDGRLERIEAKIDLLLERPSDRSH